MDILSLIEEIRQESFVPKHPLIQSDISLRYAYVIGIGLVAAADGALNEAEKNSIEQLARGLGLVEDQIERILTTVSQPDKSVIKTVIDSLTTCSEKYLFLLDAEILSDADGESGEKEKKVRQAFAEMLRLDSNDKRQQEKLSAAYYSEDWLLMQALFEQMAGDNTPWIYQTVVYYLPQPSERRAGELKTAIADCSSRLPAERPQPRRYIAGKAIGQRRYEDQDPDVALLIEGQEAQKQTRQVSSQQEANSIGFALASWLGGGMPSTATNITRTVNSTSPFEIGTDDDLGQSWDAALAKKKLLEEQLALLNAALADRYIS